MKTRIQFIISVFTLFFLGLSPQLQAVSPAPDGCYPGFTTAEGCKALNFLTTGAGNTGVGWYSLYLVGAANYNTGVGAGTLVLNGGDSNTAVGAAAMLLNTTGIQNTAVGTDALVYNDSGSGNGAVGAFALFNNLDGDGNNAFGDFALGENIHGSLNTAIGDAALAHNDVTGVGVASGNTAVGSSALFSNTDGSSNTAIGFFALLSNTNGNDNTAIGVDALVSNSEGAANTAIGFEALDATTGSGNTAIGYLAGGSLTGDGNVCIGDGVTGFAGESDHTYIRNIDTTTVSGGNSDFVTIDLNTGLLGHLSSSRRYKDNIQPMDNASEALYRLKPVSYRYKKEIDRTQSLDYGLVAEDVANVDPTLAIRDRKGQIESVRYTAVNAMLLNEFLKEHNAFVEEQHKVAQQQEEIDILKAELKEQRSLIQKVSDKVELKRSTPQVVVNNQ